MRSLPCHLKAHGMPLPAALATLRRCLPKNSVLVGQNILADVQWLGLRQGEDYAVSAYTVTPGHGCCCCC